MNSDSIPVDLITEILSRLPQKSIARFHCVSKLWASILHRPYFSKLFLTMSSAKPQILFAIEKNGAWSIFSLPQCLTSPYEKSSSSLVAAAKFHMKFPNENMEINSGNRLIIACRYASGLIYLCGRQIKDGEKNYGVPVILNPNTGLYVTLPSLLRYRLYSFFGFDPIDKQFKVLFMAYPRGPDDHKMMTLGTGKIRWRTIKCPLPHDPLSGGICINGILYYLGDYQEYVSSDEDDDDETYVIVCFDVKSEKFKFIYVQNFCTLINYKGKLCVVYRDKVYWNNDVGTIEFRVWVLEDVEKEEWSKYAYALRDYKFFANGYVYVPILVCGVTSTGEIILSMHRYTSKQPFYVFYFNPEKNTLQCIEIQGFGEYHDRAPVVIFADHVEDLKANDTIKHLIKLHTSRKQDEEEEEEEGEREDCS